MDASKKKKLLLFGGSLFVAFMFITSIGGFGNNNNSSSSATTTVSGSSAVYHAQGYANATVSGYSNNVYLVTTGLNATVNATVESILQSMMTNGTLQNYIAETNGFYAYLSTITPYQLQEYIDGNSITANTVLQAQATVKLPSKMNLTYYTNKLNVTSPSTDQSVVLSPVLPINSTVNLFVSALVTPSSVGFSVYNNGTYQIALQSV